MVLRDIFSPVSRRQERLRLCLGDFFVVCVVLLLAAFSFTASLFQKCDAPQTVQIWQNGELIWEVSVWSHLEIPVQGAYTNTVQVDYGKVAVVESDCPTQVCVHTGWCSQTGQTIICLPNGVEIRLVGGNAPQIDAVTG